jgi:recombination protein RecA
MATPVLQSHASAPRPDDPAVRTAGLVSLLRTRKLDRTLTSVAPAVVTTVAPWLWPGLNQVMRGGLPRGQVSEIVGPASSGRTSLAWAGLAAATARGERVALIDTFDRFDPERAAAAGVALSQVLWVRGQALSKTAGAVDPGWVPGVRAVQGPGTLLERTIDRAIKALNLVVQSGVCTFVVLDIIDVPVQTLARIPRSTWLRVQRIIEGTDTVVVLLGAVPLARSAGGFSLTTGTGHGEAASAGPPASASAQARGSSMAWRPPVSASGLTVPGARLGAVGRVRWRGAHDRSRRLGGLATRLRATSPRGVTGDLPLYVG